MKWLQTFLDTYQQGIAHAFILHFNVNDYIAPGNSDVQTYLQTILSKNKAIVASYSRDRGIVFATDSMKALALEVLGMAEATDQDTPAALAALQSLGMADAVQDDELPRSPDQALVLLDQLLRSNPTDDQRAGVAVLVENTELICPDAALGTMSPEDRTTLATVTRWGRDTQIMNSGLIFLMTGNQAAIHSELRTASNRYEAIEIPLPDHAVRQDFVERYVNKNKLALSDGLTTAVIGNMTAGLSLIQIEDVLLRAKAGGQLNERLIWERKQSIIRSEFGDVLEIINPKFTFDDIGGLNLVKDFFNRSVIRPIKKGRLNRVPMGILMTGPAGTGKSIMAEAIAIHSEINAVNLRIGGNIASKWQGEGERNLNKALMAIESLSPTLVFIDEIDQSIQRGGEGSGNQQDQRIFQRLLEFMSDTSHRGQVVFLAATNRPDLMDAALRRPGRFDKKIPFLVPTGEERKSIFEVMTRRYLGQVCEVSESVLKATEGWTGAEIEAATVKALELAEDYELEACEAVEQAVTKFRPSTADIEFMTLLSVKECNDLDLLPERYQALLTNRAELDKQIEAKAQPRGEREFRL